MKLLIAAFEPFGGRSCNTSADLLAELRKHTRKIGGSSYCFAILPVNFRRAWPALLSHLNRHKPGAVLLLGEKTGGSLTLEKTARNERSSKRGLIPINQNSPKKIPTSLPIKRLGAIVAARAGSGKPTFTISNSAGNYLCNFIYYKMLSSRPSTPTLFVHVPALTEASFEKKKKKFLRAISSLAIELAKAIDGAGAN